MGTARRKTRIVKDPALLFYDGHCRACTLAARLVIAADTRKRVRSATLDSKEGDRRLGKLPKEERYGAFHLYRNGRVLSGPEAIGPLLELLPPLRAAGRLLGRSKRARGASAWLYRALARRRRLIGRFLPSVGPPPR